MTNPVAVTVKILDKEYQVAAPAEERTALLDSAQLLNERMTEVRASGSVIGMDKIAVMSALNITHELIKSKEQSSTLDHSSSERVRAMCRKIETVLAKTSQLDL